MAREAWLHFLFIVTWKTRMESAWQSSVTTVRAGHMCLVKTVFVIFTIQERVCLSWPVSPVSPHTVSSLLSTSVTTRVYTFTLQLHGGCHVIPLGWRTGVEHHLAVASAHAGWPTHAQTPGLAVTVIRMTIHGMKTRQDNKTDKTTLPVIQLYFGDLGGSTEKGYHTLGKLKCYGIAWTCFNLNFFTKWFE